MGYCYYTYAYKGIVPLDTGIQGDTATTHMHTRGQCHWIQAYKGTLLLHIGIQGDSASGYRYTTERATVCRNTRGH